MKDGLKRNEESASREMLNMSIPKTHEGNEDVRVLPPASHAICRRGTAGNPRAAVGLIKDARALWSRKAKGSIIEGAFQNAADAKSGLENGLRSEFGKLLKSPKYNWTPDERAAIRQVVRGGVKANALRFLGTFGYSPDQARSFLGTVIGAGAGGALGGGIGAVALPAVGTAARFASRSLAKSRANNVSALVRNGGAAPFDAARAAAVTDRVDPLLKLGGRAVAVPLTLKALSR